MRPDELLEELLRLPTRARADMAARLLRSLEDDEADDTYEQAWSDEVVRRLQEVEAGAVRLIPRDEVASILAADDSTK